MKRYKNFGYYRFKVNCRAKHVETKCPDLQSWRAACSCSQTCKGKEESYRKWKGCLYWRCWRRAVRMVGRRWGRVRKRWRRVMASIARTIGQLAWTTLVISTRNPGPGAGTLVQGGVSHAPLSEEPETKQFQCDRCGINCVNGSLLENHKNQWKISGMIWHDNWITHLHSIRNSMLWSAVWLALKNSLIFW